MLLWLRRDLCYTVRMKNIQPYLSALNKCHEHIGLDPVALGKDVVGARKAIAQQQAAVMEEATRVRLPAEHAEKVLIAALKLEVDPQIPATLRLLRGSVAMLVDFCAGSRGNTGGAPACRGRAVVAGWPWWAPRAAAVSEGGGSGG